jgi:hypothetical protein
MEPDTRIPVPGRTVASRLIGGRALILDPKEDALHHLNEVGSFLWSLICERRLTADQLRQHVVETFDVEPEAADADLQAFLVELAAKGYVDYVEEASDVR